MHYARAGRRGPGTQHPLDLAAHHGRVLAQQPSCVPRLREARPVRGRVGSRVGGCCWRLRACRPGVAFALAGDLPHRPELVPVADANRPPIEARTALQMKDRKLPILEVVASGGRGHHRHRPAACVHQPAGQRRARCHERRLHFSGAARGWRRLRCMPPICKKWHRLSIHFWAPMIAIGLTFVARHDGRDPIEGRDMRGDCLASVLCCWAPSAALSLA